MEAAIRAQGVLNEVELAPGTVLAGYQLLRVVSRTRGVHLVYEAVDPAGQRVAMKLVSRGLGQNRRFRDRFEPLLAKRSAIEHPHLLPILDRGEFVDADVPGTTCLFVVSEFVDSPTLSACSTSGHPTRMQRCACWARWPTDWTPHTPTASFTPT